MRHAEQTVPASRTGAGLGEGTFPCCSAFHIPRSAFWGGAVTVWAWDSVSVTLGVSGPRGLRFTGVSTDTRHLTPGALFVALKGERFDAHDFLPDAKGRGAAAAVVRRGTPPVDGLPFFEVPDTLEALATLAVVTNVGYAHVAGFGSVEGVMREKLALVDGVPLAVVGIEPPSLGAEARRRARTVVAGSDPGADVHPESAELDDAGRPRIRWAGAEVTLPVVGFHQIENAMVAVAVARGAGADPVLALAALRDVRLPPGRGSVLAVRGLTVIDDTYNANPSSLRWAVRFAHWLAGRRGRPLVVVVGSMLELGVESARLHAAAAREIAALRPALIGAVGEFAPAFAGLEPPLHARLLTAPDAAALGPRLRAALRGDEVVLLKASRGVALERVLADLN